MSKCAKPSYAGIDLSTRSILCNIFLVIYTVNGIDLAFASWLLCMTRYEVAQARQSPLPWLMS